MLAMLGIVDGCGEVEERHRLTVTSHQIPINMLLFSAHAPTNSGMCFTYPRLTMLGGVSPHHWHI